MTTPGHMRSWRGWTDEARSHSTDGLVNGRPATADELEILGRARVAARESEAAGLFAGVNPITTHDNHA